jgi:hypothetical protein
MAVAGDLVLGMQPGVTQLGHRFNNGDAEVGARLCTT